MALATLLLNILENKRAKNLEKSAKCAYKPIFSYSIKNSILPKNVTYALLAFSQRNDNKFCISVNKYQ